MGRILYIQIIEGPVWRGKASIIAQKNIIINPMRGNILSDDGRVLATSVPYYEIRIDFRADGLKKDLFYANVDSLSIELAKLFKDKTANEYKNILVNGYKKGLRYFLLKRRIDYATYKKLKNFPLFRLGRNKGGFIANQVWYRSKPFGQLASRTLGYTSADRIVVGIEGAFDSYLRGKEGLQLMQRISGGEWMPINNGNTIEPQDGYDVITSLDLYMQDVAHQALYTHLKKHNAKYGCVIVMETKTGYIKAISNLEYDSIKQDYFEKFNYAIGESVEPGSTFKLVTMLAALEEGCIKITDTINTGNGVTTYAGYKMKDSHEGGYGKITVADVFAYSSNVGTSKIAVQCFGNNPRAYIDRINSLHLNEKIGLDIKGEGIPVIKDPSDPSWSALSLPWMSIGYEVKITPMQILMLYNAVANNGMMLKPQLIKEINYRGQTIKKFEPQVLNPSICTRETIKDLKYMLERVVEKGTAKNLSNAPYKIAGKTGTAQIARGKQGYKDENEQITYRASFVGYFPADNPHYSIIVIVNSPSNSVYYGNVVAGPIFREIADKIYATHVEMQKEFASNPNSIQLPQIKNGYFDDIKKLTKYFNFNINTASNNHWACYQYTNNSIVVKNLNNNKNLMPNVVGMGLRDALHLLENMGLDVRVIGRGKIVKQSLPPGYKFSEGDIVYLELS